jgi:hypothetical protein
MLLPNALALISPIAFILGGITWFIGIKGICDGVTSYYNQARICTIHRGKISKDELLFYCPSCNTLYCKKCYEQVVKKEGCWNCLEGSQIEETEKTEQIDVVEFVKEKDAKIKDVPGSKVGGVDIGRSPLILKMIQDKLDTKYYNCSKCTQLKSANSFCSFHERKVNKKDICKSFEPIHGGFGAKKVSRRSINWKHGSSLEANRRCGKCIFHQNKYCHAHKKATTVNEACCEDFEYIYERSEEFLHKKD